MNVVPLGEGAVEGAVEAEELEPVDVEPTRPSLVMAATAWPTNADLIVDVARLGYLLETDRVLDPTYGRGRWWSKWRPAGLVAHDRRLDGSDFRKLPYPDAGFDAVAFDPPYVCQGGRKTTTAPEFHDRYGLGDAPMTPAALQELIDDGLTEAHRLAKPNGIVLVKTKDYVTGGRLWLGTHRTLTHAFDLGFELLDRLEHVGATGPQSQTRQVHARRNLSTMFVLRKGKHVR